MPTTWTMLELSGTARQVSFLELKSTLPDTSKEQSRGFGFLRFSTIDDAISFMDRNYPNLYLYGDSSKASSDPDEAKVRISYGRERRDNRNDEADWICSSVCDHPTSQLILTDLAVQHQQFRNTDTMLSLSGSENWYVKRSSLCSLGDAYVPRLC